MYTGYAAWKIKQPLSNSDSMIDQANEYIDQLVQYWVFGCYIRTVEISHC